MVMNIDVNCILNYSDVKFLLDKFGNLFVPVLSSEVDIDEYSKKLSEKAKFTIARNPETNEIVGFISFYENLENHSYFFSLMAILPDYQHSGLGHIMMNRMKAELDGKRIKKIVFEVHKNNTKALSFHLRNGYVVCEDRGNKVLMEYLPK